MMRYKPFITLGACRKNAGLKQSELAAALNVSVTTVKNWEKYEHVPPADKLIMLSKLSKVPLDFIILSKELSKTVNNLDNEKINERE